MEALRGGLRATSIRNQFQTQSFDTCFTYLIHIFFRYGSNTAAR